MIVAVASGKTGNIATGVMKTGADYFFAFAMADDFIDYAGAIRQGEIYGLLDVSFGGLIRLGSERWQVFLVFRGHASKFLRLGHGCFERDSIEVICSGGSTLFVYPDGNARAGVLTTARRGKT